MRDKGHNNYSSPPSQVVSNVAQDCSSRLPGVLRSLYAGVALLQLQGVSLPPACLDGYPFSNDVAILGLAVGAWLLSLAAALVHQRHFTDSVALRRAVTVCTLLALYLHPSASSSALRMLDCRTVQLTAAAVAALEDSAGGSTASSTQLDFSASASLTTVSVLASNPVVPCFGRLHAPAGGFAAAALLAYIAALPAFTLVWLWRDARLAFDLGVLRQTSGLGRRRRSRVNAIDGKSLQEDAPIRNAAALPPPPRSTPMLHPFLGGSDYGAPSWYLRHVDMVILFCLAATKSLLSTPASLAEVTTKLAVTLSLLTLLAVVLVAVPNPFLLRWKRPVRIGLIVLSAACACVDAASRALDLGYGGPALAATLTPGAYVIIILTVVTLSALIAGYGYDFLSKALEAYRDSHASVAGASPPSPAPDGDRIAPHDTAAASKSLDTTTRRPSHSGTARLSAPADASLVAPVDTDHVSVVLAVDSSAAPTSLVVPEVQEVYRSLGRRDVATFRRRASSRAAGDAAQSPQQDSAASKAAGHTLPGNSSPGGDAQVAVGRSSRMADVASSADGSFGVRAAGKGGDPASIPRPNRRWSALNINEALLTHGAEARCVGSSGFAFAGEPARAPSSLGAFDAFAGTAIELASRVRARHSTGSATPGTSPIAGVYVNSRLSQGQVAPPDSSSSRTQCREPPGGTRRLGPISSAGVATFAVGGLGPPGNVIRVRRASDSMIPESLRVFAPTAEARQQPERPRAYLFSTAMSTTQRPSRPDPAWGPT